MDFKQLAEQYKDELLGNVLPFWLNKSQDKEYGGYYTCLLRNGDVFDTDKFIWLQGREVWLFSMLYNKVEKRQEWLDCAIQRPRRQLQLVFLSNQRRQANRGAIQHLLLHFCHNGIRAAGNCHGQ